MKLLYLHFLHLYLHLHLRTTAVVRFQRYSIVIFSKARRVQVTLHLIQLVTNYQQKDYKRSFESNINYVFYVVAHLFTTRTFFEVKNQDVILSFAVHQNP